MFIYKKYELTFSQGKVYCYIEANKLQTCVKYQTGVHKLHKKKDIKTV